jgi:hypothetical protein
VCGERERENSERETLKGGKISAMKVPRQFPLVLLELCTYYLVIQSVPQGKHFTVTEINRLTPFMQTIAVYIGNHMKHINTSRRQNAVLRIFKESGIYSYHSA